MTVYVDSSVLLAVILDEPGRLQHWNEITRRVASELIRVECLRTIDRARLRFGHPDRLVAELRVAVLEQLQTFFLVPLDSRVLERASGAFPTPLGSLDALHLASALAAKRQMPDLRLATHDAELAVAARAVGLMAIGVPRA